MSQNWEKLVLLRDSNWVPVEGETDALCQFLLPKQLKQFYYSKQWTVDSFLERHSCIVGDKKESSIRPGLLYIYIYIYILHRTCFKFVYRKAQFPLWNGEGLDKQTEVKQAINKLCVSASQTIFRQ
jgi:hypothetical protein